MATVALKPKASIKRPQALISGDDQGLTNTWANLGGVISVKGANKVTLWIELDIGSSQNARVRAVAKMTADATDVYSFPIESVNASDIKVEDEYYEFNVDADQLMVLEFDMNDSIPYIQFQVQDSNGGNGVIKADSCYVTFA